MMTMEMSIKQLSLSMEMDSSIIHLEQELISREETINNLANENNILQTGITQQTVELDEAVASLNSYKESHTL